MDKASTGSVSASAQQDVIFMPVERLLLDEENPRLASGTGGDTQEDLLRVLWTEMAVDELALSIAANGFFKEEPLFVVPENSHAPEDKRKYVVIEGNRRLAAVILLRDKSLREKLGATELPGLSAEERAKLDRLPVSIYQNRKQLWEYYGFRHINGPKPWDAYSKAKYVADVHENYNISLKEIANRIGDRHATVARLYRGYKLLEQAEKQTSFAKEDRVRNRFYFSHLYTAADQQEFQRFLGITADDSLKRNPVAKAKLSKLEELMVWLYGSKTKNREPLVHTQNPDLNILREVISKPNGLSALRAGYSLARAYEIGFGDKRRFREALTRAKEELQQAKATVTPGFTGEPDLYETMGDIIQVAETIRTEMDAILGKKKSRPSRVS
jgi:hypothetical protein